jgi:hypothetical protein
MRKSREKTGKTFDLDLRGVPGKPDPATAKKSRYPAVRSAGAYLDFLEEFPPALKNEDPVKIFSERFVL